MKITKLPELYKLRDGKVLFWRMSIEDSNLITEYGQAKLDGDNLVYGKTQKTIDEIKVGKNIGRSNETTKEQQALSEGQSKWEYQINRRGYSPLIQAANDIPRAMLAQDYSDHKLKVKFPCYIQPKLDGIRCLASKGKLYSRTQTEFESVPDIAKGTLDLLSLARIKALDGELYNHDYKNDFEKITSAVRQETETEMSKIIQYHIYDIIDTENSTFEERWTFLLKVFFENPHITNFKLVKTIKIFNEEELELANQQNLDAGYEGSIIRNADGLYEEDRRSFGLLKKKEFKDAEFDIIGYEEGRGKLVGHIAAFVCQMENGNQFKAKMKGSLDNLKLYFEDHSLWMGKKLTVQYQGLSAYGIPRFPVGLRFREANSV